MVYSGAYPETNASARNDYTINTTHMLATIAVVLLVLWALGLVTSYTLGGFIHLLLVLAIIFFLVRLIQGRNPVA